MRFACCGAVVILLAGLAVPGKANNLVQDGGFEISPPACDTGFGPYWLASGTVTMNTGIVHSGSCSVAFGATPPDSGSLSQLLATVPGVTYSVQFWLFPGESTDPGNSFFLEYVNGVLGADATSSAPNVWTFFSSQFTGTGVDTLTFQGANTYDTYFLDDVSVDTPEPGSFGLLGCALVAAMAASRRLRRRA
jgi:hypothetical protein